MLLLNTSIIFILSKFIACIKCPKYRLATLYVEENLAM